MTAQNTTNRLGLSCKVRMQACHEEVRECLCGIYCASHSARISTLAVPHPVRGRTSMEKTADVCSTSQCDQDSRQQGTVSDSFWLKGWLRCILNSDPAVGCLLGGWKAVDSALVCTNTYLRTGGLHAIFYSAVFVHEKSENYGINSTFLKNDNHWPVWRRVRLPPP
jgi:hypothetical protein